MLNLRPNRISKLPSNMTAMRTFADLSWLSFFEKNRNSLQSNKIKVKLSQRIEDVFNMRAYSSILGDEDDELTGQKCLEIAKKIKDQIQALTPVRARVAILFPPGTTQSLSILAVMMAERVPVILNHWVNEKSLEDIIIENDLHAIVTYPHSHKRNMPSLSPIPHIELNQSFDIVEVNNRKTEEYFKKPLPETNTALILYTSGSTGKSKGVKISEESLSYMVDLLIDKLSLDETTTATITLPIFHTMALITQFLPTFFAGGKSIIINTELCTGKWYRLIQQSSGTFTALISDMLKYCKDEKVKRNLPAAEKVKLLQLAGGHISAKHLELARELFPNALIYKGYGLTEAIRVTMISSDDPHFDKDSAGYPLPGQEVNIRDEHGNNLPHEAIGEIHVKGPNLMLGYEAGIPSQITEDGFLATGDYGYVSKEGLLVIQGRKDHVFKSNGRKIAPKEIEQYAIELSSVLKAKCVAVPCEQKGLKPILLIEVDRENIELHAKEWKNELIRNLKSKLEPYKVPKQIVVTDIPKLANGKMDHPKAEKLWKRQDKFSYIGKAAFGCHFHLL
ncbi:MAG: class I adenylate-forming enzyme family protein [Bdellovibrionota bacterium]